MVLAWADARLGALRGVRMFSPGIPLSIELRRPVGPEGYSPENHWHWPHEAPEACAAPFPQRLPDWYVAHGGWLRGVGGRRGSAGGRGGRAWNMLEGDSMLGTCSPQAAHSLIPRSICCRPGQEGRDRWRLCVNVTLCICVCKSSFHSVRKGEAVHLVGNRTEAGAPSYYRPAGNGGDRSSRARSSTARLHCRSCESRIWAWGHRRKEGHPHATRRIQPRALNQKHHNSKI